jgi:uncharacterized protein YcfJ
MKKLIAIVFILSLSLGSMTACTKRQVGTSVGAGAGAGLGYAVGGGWGAAAGAVGGALIGDAVTSDHH